MKTWMRNPKRRWEIMEGASLVCIIEPAMHAEYEARAALIAAAPELLEALEGLLKSDGVEAMSFLHPAKLSAVQAFSKAKGLKP